MTSAIPSWLEEHCFRLSVQDEQLTNLNLNIRRMNPIMMKALALSMNDNHTLRTLNLTSSLAQSGEDALIPLAEQVLPYHPSLQVLHLCYNRLTDVTGIGYALRTNQALKELYLDYNQIGSSCISALAKGLGHNTTLEVLHMSYNEIGDVGCQALAQHALNVNTTLRTLQLDRNCITDNGVQSLLSTIQNHNVTIQNISLNLNPIMTSSSSSTQPKMAQLDVLVRANRAGRKFITSQPQPKQQQQQQPPQQKEQPLGLWPRLLERVNDDPNVMLYLVSHKLDLLLQYHNY